MAFRGLNALTPVVNERLMTQRERVAQLEQETRLRKKALLASRAETFAGDSKLESETEQETAEAASGAS